MTVAGRLPLAGRRVLVTRERPGDLARLLEARGAEVVHIPLIEVIEPLDHGRALTDALSSLRPGDWLLVTSPQGAQRAGAVADMVEVRLGAVGTATARRLAEVARRPVELVPERQIATELAAAVLAAAAASPPAPVLEAPGSQLRGPEIPPTRSSARVVVAQGDLAADTLVDALRRGGLDAVGVTAYRTVTRTPDPADLARLADGIDALVLASGSAAHGWVDAVGADSPLTPPVVVAIGPTTADAARSHGLTVTGVSARHTLDGLVAEVESQLADDRRHA